MFTYVDDLVIFSDTSENHLDCLKAMLEKLQEFRLTANMAKCQWALIKCTYLWDVVSGGHVKPDVNKLEAVENVPEPKTKKLGHS